MSKIVDLLTYRKRTADKKGYEELFSPKIITENFDTKTKEHLANTYILSPLNKPANIKKEGSSFDLPIAIGYLAATSQIELDK